MKVRAEFEVRVAGEFGLGMPGQTLPRPFQLSTGAYEITITPYVSINVQIYDDDAGPQEESYLEKLQAVVTREFDTSLGKEAERQIYNELRRTAVAYLRRVMVHLRAMTGHAGLDVYLASLTLLDFSSDDGSITRRPFFEVSRHLAFIGYVDDERWDAVVAAVSANAPLRIDEEWLRDAMAHHWGQNYNMALFAAAVACEIAAYAVIRDALTASGVSKTQAETFVREVSNRELLPTMLTYLGLADTSTVEAIRRTFEARNQIAHAVQARSTPRVSRFSQISESQSWDAINAARFLIGKHNPPA